jgi:hypothetical protein
MQTQDLVVLDYRGVPLPPINGNTLLHKRMMRTKVAQFAQKVFCMMESEEEHATPQLFEKLSNRRVTKIVCGDNFNVALTCTTIFFVFNYR